jgi:ABC-2 type transport system permease protein
VPIIAGIVAVLGAGSGVAVVMTVVGVTPGVDPHRRVNATDAGENTFTIMVALHAVVLAILPTAAMAAVLVFAAPPPSFAMATLAVAVVNAAVVASVSGAVAARRLESHLPETFARLRYPGLVVTTDGHGLLDRLSGRAERTALAAAAAAKGERAAAGRTPGRVS